MGLEVCPLVTPAARQKVQTGTLPMRQFFHLGRPLQGTLGKDLALK
jgi:hypothetical protein